MKTKNILIIISVLILSATATFAVSIDWKMIEAVEMSDVTVHSYQIDSKGPPTVETSIEFYGPELSYFLNLLPMAEGENGEDMKHLRILEILGKDEKSVTLECASHEYDSTYKLTKIKNGPNCKVVITKGPRAG